jgi:hypothetical protein
LKTVEAKKVERAKKTAGVRFAMNLLRFLGLRGLSTAKAREIKITKVKRTRFHGLKCSTATRHRQRRQADAANGQAVDAQRGLTDTDRTLWPSLPQVPTPLSSRMSLPSW